MPKITITLLSLFFSVSLVAQNKTIDISVPDETTGQSVTLQVELDGSTPLVIGADGTVSASGLTSVNDLCAGVGLGECPECNCDGVQVEIKNFSVNGQTAVSIFPNDTLNFAWGSQGAWECVGSGLPTTTWNTLDKAPDGTQQITSPDLEPGATYSAALVCSNGPVQSLASTVQVDVIAPDPVPAGCEGRNPEQFARATSCIHSGSAFGADCTSYREVFGSDDNPFPGPDGSARNFILNRGQYAAMQFVVPQNFDREGAWNVVESQFVVPTAGDRIWSISKCPGDFDQQAIEAESTGRCYVKSGNTSSIAYQPSGGGDRFRCELEPGETYYLNVVFTDSASGTAPNDLNWFCPSGVDTCGNNMSVTSRRAN